MGDGQGVWDSHVHTVTLRIVNQRGPTVQHMELHSMLRGSLDGKECGGECRYVYVWLSLSAAYLKISQHS